MAVALIVFPVVVLLVLANAWSLVESPRFLAQQWLGKDSRVQAVIFPYTDRQVSQDVTGFVPHPAASPTTTEIAASRIETVTSQNNAIEPVDAFGKARISVKDANPQSQTLSTTVIQTPYLRATQVQAVAGLDPSATINAGEALISTDVADELGVAVGDQIKIDVPLKDIRSTSLSASASPTVVDIVSGSKVVIVGEDTLSIDRFHRWRDVHTVWYIIGADPVSWEQVLALNEYGFLTTSRSVMDDYAG
ncbi:MAG: hypothetical protein CSA82_01925, partial [Actinobacteria bacterium]